jgi:putative ABC transport system substrate-binding protein
VARSATLVGLATVILLYCIGTFADDSRKSPHIGLLLGGSPSSAKPYEEAFIEGMRVLGYVDGKTATISRRYANGDATRHPVLVRELIAHRVDVLVVSTAGVRAAMGATTTIPIVCPVFGSDPVRDGLVVSLAHPGGNVTGLYPLGTETDSKRLQFAMELVPGLKRVALLFESTNPGWVADANALHVAAQSSRVTLRTYGVRDQNEIQLALSGIDKDQVQALIVLSNPVLNQYRETIMKWAHTRIPVISEQRDWAEAGALLTYSANFFEMYKQSAVYVDKILNGARAAELPIEQTSKFELVVNLKAAKQFGIAVPKSVLVQADEILK